MAIPLVPDGIVDLGMQLSRNDIAKHREFQFVQSNNISNIVYMGSNLPPLAALRSEKAP
ncbi:hypothetical protein PQU96_02195 [Vogesella sp. LYT5W]|uniref:Uncharacterized protein n=1 Tax=Vogesella margarita TaxID=2984199 RepID=A0ABT5IK67_9NEIS|nr:hypothetical protein [Vogesella margarita]MDC7712945.1 hypothetical protein [Vogesella margarita]